MLSFSTEGPKVVDGESTTGEPIEALTEVVAAVVVVVAVDDDEDPIIFVDDECVCVVFIFDTVDRVVSGAATAEVSKIRGHNRLSCEI